MALMVEEVDARHTEASPAGARPAQRATEGEASRLRALARDLGADRRRLARRSAD